MFTKKGFKRKPVTRDETLVTKIDGIVERDTLLAAQKAEDERKILVITSKAASMKRKKVRLFIVVSGLFCSRY